MADLSSKVAELNQKIERLETQFNFYFTGQERVPPLKQLAALKADVMRLMDMEESVKTVSDKFLIQTLVQKFTTHRIKWERGVKDIEEGRAKPGLHFFGGLGTALTAEALSSLEGSSSAVRKVAENEKKIELAAEKYIELSQKYMNKTYDRTVIMQTLNARMKEIRSKYGDNFKLDVFFDGKTVKIKPVGKEEE